MRSPVSCELGTCSISSESSPSTIWGAAAIPPGLHEPVWAELDRHALRLFGPRRSDRAAAGEECKREVTNFAEKSENMIHFY